VLPPAITERKQGSSKKPVILQWLSPVLPGTIHPHACHVYPRGAGHAREILDLGEPVADGCSVMVNGLERAVSSRSGEVKIALVLNKLRDGDVLHGDGVMGVSCNHRVPMPIIVCGCQKSL
jgi:hypothetical protein